MSCKGLRLAFVYHYLLFLGVHGAFSPFNIFDVPNRFRWTFQPLPRRPDVVLSPEIPQTVKPEITVTEKPEERDCILPYVQFPEIEPVFFHTSYQLIKPKNNAIILRPRDTVYLVCPGRGNFLQASNMMVTTATCVRDTILQVNMADRELSTLNCKQSVTGDLKEWPLFGRCGNGRGQYIGIGHEVPSVTFASLFLVCYDYNSGASIYSDHTIYGSAINHGKSSSSRPSFKIGHLNLGMNHKAYTQAKQHETFTWLFASREIADRYINSRSFLARGHLAPDADFVYMSSRWSTYFYVNVMPQWQAVNNGNWKALEAAIRNLAGTQQKNFQVITGSHDILMLEGRLIYLDYGRLPVPKFTWKIVKNTETGAAIAFVTLNNPFKEVATPDDFICSDITYSSGWLLNNFKDMSKGLTYACSVESLRAAIPTAPDVHHNGGLAGPNALSIAVEFLTELFRAAGAREELRRKK